MMQRYGFPIVFVFLMFAFIGVSSAQQQQTIACEDWPAAADSLTEQRNIAFALHSRVVVRASQLERENADLRHKVKMLEDAALKKGTGK